MTSSRCALQAAEPHQILDVLRGEQILAGGQRRVIGVGDLGKQRKIQRIARLLEPAQPERREAARISQRLVTAEFRIGIDRKLSAARQNRFHRLDPRQIVGELHAADFHLHHGVAGIEMTLHLVGQIPGGFAGRIPAAADIAKNLVGDFAALVTLGKQPMQRFAGDLGHRVPDRDLDGADADRALAVAAGFLVLQHHGEDFFRRKIIARLVEQRLRIGLEHARNEARPHLRAAGISPGRVEGEAADRLAFTYDIGDDGDHRRSHLGKIDARIGQRRVQRDRCFADVGDAHLGEPLSFFFKPASRSQEVSVAAAPDLRFERLSTSWPILDTPAY